ncbi:MAG: hypothetical protein L0312_32885, partial [Acidobacteria bacterium]|nr:hypothetical protein [Acidobacteriota bacterium]
MFSREEALRDVREEAASGKLARFFKSLKNRTRDCEDLRRWQLLLSGRSHDEQLWAVRPPQSSFNDPLIKEWVAKTLELAGYD